MRKLCSIWLAFAVPASLAGAQTATALSSAPGTQREGVTVWAGLGSEFLLLPGAHLGLSVGLGRAGAGNVSLRGTVDTLGLPGADGFLPVVGADLLLSGPAGRVTVYGGPGAGAVLGRGWAVGGTLGVRDTFGAGRLGWFSEARARALLGSGDLAGSIVVSPGLRAGLTYRF